MELIVVTPPAYFEGEGQLVNRLFDLGLQRLHIRKPVNDVVLFRKLMMEVKPEYYPAIAIHQHHELAAEFSLQRLHFTASQRALISSADLDELKGQGITLSSSIHGVQELLHVNGFDYVFFGPVYNSISKAGYESVLAADFILPKQRVKVIAIGGVTADQLEALKYKGFSGAAVLGALWHKTSSPEAEMICLLKALTKITNQSYPL